MFPFPHTRIELPLVAEERAVAWAPGRHIDRGKACCIYMMNLVPRCLIWEESRTPCVPVLLRPCPSRRFHPSLSLDGEVSKLGRVCYASAVHAQAATAHPKPSHLSLAPHSPNVVNVLLLPFCLDCGIVIANHASEQRNKCVGGGSGGC